MNVGVIGCGSIGLRHIRNLGSLGVGEVHGSDPDPRARSAAAALGAHVHPSIDEMLRTRPRAVLVCTPPSDHVSHAHAVLDAGADLLIEKPLASDLRGAPELLDRVRRDGRILMVGYNLRFDRGLQRVSELMRGGAIGRTLSIRAEFGQYLPDWRPGTDHRESYTADPERGGGIVLDASHELDYLRWLGGDAATVYAVTGTIGELGITAEDIAAIVIRLRSGALGEVHLDCLQRAYARSCKVVGTEGTLVWDPTTGVRAYYARVGQWAPIEPPHDRNDAYLAEVQHYLDRVRDRNEPDVTGRDGLLALQIAMAAKASSAEGRELALDVI